MPSTSPLEGGLYDRFVEESVHRLIVDHLADLGWMNLGPKYRPLTVLAAAVDPGDTIHPNTLIIEPEDVEAETFELGQTASVADQFVMYADFYCSDRPGSGSSTELGKHLAGDIRKILEGGLPSIGRTNNSAPVYDFRELTPPQIGYCTFHDVRTVRDRVYDQPWEGSIFSTQFIAIYGR